jgi:membrane protein YdbS with pleckstrin-like domain
MDPDDLEHFDPRQRAYRSDATLWVWIMYGLTQAVVTLLIAFDVLTTTTAAEVVTAVALVLYVAVNELIVRPHRRVRRHTSGPPLPPPTGDGG